jgi:DNA polymerase-1
MDIKSTQADAYKLLHQGTLALARAERQGLRIDRKYCTQEQNKITELISNLEGELKQSSFYKEWTRSRGRKKLNIDSNAQLGEYLYEVCGHTPPKLTPSGLGSTDKESLKQLDIPEIQTILRIRKLKKIRDTYLKGFMKEQINGFIHPHFKLHTATTYRSSSSSPNFQNIPKRDKEAQKICRSALYPRRGHQLLEVDYSGMEVRASIFYHNDPTMKKYINDPDSDMHGDMAQQIFKIDDFDRSRPEHDTLRSAAKNGFVFPQFYGDYYGNNAPTLACSWGEMPENKRWESGQGISIGDEKNLGEHLVSHGFRSLKSFTNHVQDIEEDFWERRFEVYNQWKKDWWRKYQNQGYIEMLTGFRCHGPMSKNDATNYPVQGTAFHCLLWSFITVDKILTKKNMKTRIIGQVHDSIVLDVYPKELDKVCRLLEYVMTKKIRKHWPWVNVPLDMDADLGGVDESWNELEEYKFDEK